MIEKKQNEPKLRFPAFGGDWKLKNVEELFERVKNPVKVIGNQEYQQIGIRSHGKGIFYKEKVSGSSLGNKAVFWIEPNVFIVNIVFAWERAVAITSENEVGMIASHRFPMYKPKEGLTVLNFILYFFKTQRGHQLLIDASPGGAGRNKTLGQKEFGIQKLYLPEYSEQEKIGHFFSKLDQRIEAEEKKLRLLQEQKKGYMQKIFSREFRFKDETGNDFPDWRDTQIGNILKIKHGKSQHKIEKKDGKYPILATGGIIGYTDTPICTHECVLIGRKGTINKPYYMDEPFWTVDTLFYSIPEAKELALFQYYLFQTINWTLYNEGSTVPSLSASTIESISVIVPNLEEQKQIAAFFSVIDNKIDEFEKKVELLKEQKKGLMQQMFI